MQSKEMTCIRCPLGCALTATADEKGNITVTGNTCPKGEEYALGEIRDPRRTVTSTVRIKGRQNRVVSVKTSEDIPKGKIMECMEALGRIEAVPPVEIGDILLKNVADTGADILATCKII